MDELVTVKERINFKQIFKILNDQQMCFELGVYRLWLNSLILSLPIYPKRLEIKNTFTT